MVRALGMLSVTHIMPVLVLLSVVGVGMQQHMIQNLYLTFKTQQTPTKYLYGHTYAVDINSFRQLFPDKIFFPDISLIFSRIHDISLKAVKFPDISRFSTQVVTLNAV